jgi:hypothetical protein
VCVCVCVFCNEHRLLVKMYSVSVCVCVCVCATSTVSTLRCTVCVCVSTVSTLRCTVCAHAYSFTTSTVSTIRCTVRVCVTALLHTHTHTHAHTHTHTHTHAPPQSEGYRAAGMAAAPLSKKRKPPREFDEDGQVLQDMLEFQTKVADLPFDVHADWTYDRKSIERKRNEVSKKNPRAHLLTDSFSRTTTGEKVVVCWLQCKGRTDACTVGCGAAMPLCHKKTLDVLEPPRSRKGKAAKCACGKPTDDSHRTRCSCQEHQVDAGHFRCQCYFKLVISGLDLSTLTWYEGASVSATHKVTATQPFRAIPQVNTPSTPTHHLHIHPPHTCHT